MWRTVVGSSATVQTHYVFDEAGHLLAEHDGATGAVLREYVWLDDTPVAMIDSTGTSPVTDFIHTGQIEEPLVMTDAAQNKVWDAYVEPFGQAQVFGTPSAGLDLRLPGQFTEAETGGLNQNWNRNYDPSLGRYIEADPLGIGAGQNVYGYVDGDPLWWIDPRGLSYATSWTVWGAGIGGTATAAASVAVDVGTGGLNIVATPAEVAAGASLGALIGNRLGALVDWLICPNNLSPLSKPTVLHATQSRPLRGKPGSVIWVNGQGRRYGPDGYPETDVDVGHDHNGIGDPHGHDWGRPADGSPPTDQDRGKARPPAPTDPKAP